MGKVKGKKKREHFKGCLMGGAIGDAFGAPVDLLSFAEIKKEYGDQGLLDLVCDEKGKAIITDDTQLTLFTAEGYCVLKRGKGPGCLLSSFDCLLCLFIMVIYTRLS